MCQMGPYGLVMTGKDVYSMAFNQAVVSTKLLLGYHPSTPFGFSFFFSALALAPVKLISFFHPPPPLSLLLRLMQNPSTPVIKISPCLLFSAERTCKIKAPAVAFYFLFFLSIVCHPLGGFYWLIEHLQTESIIRYGIPCCLHSIFGNVWLTSAPVRLIIVTALYCFKCSYSLF